MIVVGFQGAAGSCHPAGKSSLMAKVRARHEDDSITRIGSKNWVIGAGLERGNRVGGAEGTAQHRISRSQFESDRAAEFPAIAEVKLNVMPALLREGIQLGFTCVPGRAG